MGQWTYRSTFSWPLHWLEVGGQLHALAALPQRKCPSACLDSRLGRPQNLPGQCGGQNILKTRTPTHQPAHGQSLYLIWNRPLGQMQMMSYYTRRWEDWKRKPKNGTRFLEMWNLKTTWNQGAEMMQTWYKYVRFEVLVAVIMKITVSFTHCTASHPRRYQSSYQK
jgi:hypothetical protein